MENITSQTSFFSGNNTTPPTHVGIAQHPKKWGLGARSPIGQFTWLMQWNYCEIREAKEDKVRRNLVKARSLEGLGALGKLGLEGLLLFMYPNFIP